jgi:hypothetical protein
MVEMHQNDQNSRVFSLSCGAFLILLSFMLLGAAFTKHVWV